jgi:predicted S18 family serine protease
MRRLPVIALLLVLAAGCSEPPQKEIDQAQGAIDAARAAGADKYAVDEYTAATTALQKAQDAVTQRDYRQALSYALDARERAHDAARAATDGKARAHATAETRIADISTRVQQLEARVKSAEAARVAARDLRAGRATLTEARTALQKARTAFDGGDYQGAIAAINGMREKLDAATRQVAADAQRASRRKK